MPEVGATTKREAKTRRSPGRRGPARLGKAGSERDRGVLARAEASPRRGHVVASAGATAAFTRM